MATPTTKRKWWHGLYYVVFFFLMILIHRKMWIVSDDAVFINYLDEMTLLEFIAKVFGYTTGKYLTDPLGALLVKMDFTAWQIMDSAICTVALYLVNDLCTCGEQTLTDSEPHWAYIFSALLMLCFPVSYLISAGFIVTTTNYLYTSFAILVIFWTIRCRIDAKDKCGFFDILLLLICSIYACNQEQAACLAIGLMLVNIGIHLSKGQSFRTTKGFYATCGTIIVMVISFASVLLSPGHIARSNSTEGPFSIPGYMNWSVLQKLLHGYTTTAANLLYGSVVLYLIYTFLVMLLGLKTKKSIIRFLSCIPFLYEAYTFWAGGGKLTYYPTYGFGMLELTNFSGLIKNMLSAGIPLLMFAIICLVLWESIENKEKAVKLILYLIIGVGTRVMMGFSSTLFGSSFRTFIYLLFIMGFECVAIFNDIKRHKNYRVIVLTAVSCAAYYMINLNYFHLG